MNREENEVDRGRNNVNGDGNNVNRRGNTIYRSRIISNGNKNTVNRAKGYL